MTSPAEGYRQWLVDGEQISRPALLWLRRQITAMSKGGNSDGTGRFRASLIGSPCDRQKVYSYLGAEQNYHDGRFAMNGTWSHLRMGVAGLSQGFLRQAEVKVKYGNWFAGKADGITDDGRLFEFKTIHSRVLYKLTEPRAMHRDQMIMYLHALKLPMGVILYEGRDSMDLVEFDVPFDHMRYQELVSDARRMKGFIDAGMRPDMHPECTPKSTMRKYCDFSRVCIDDWALENLDDTDSPVIEEVAGA